MNFGKKDIQRKQKQLNSSLTMMGKKAKISTLRVLFLSIIAFCMILICLSALALQHIIRNAPDISNISIIPLNYATLVYDADGNQLQKLNSSEGNRISVSINKIPKSMKTAIVMIEDSRFYKHKGVDLLGILRAAVVSIITGFRHVQGASTITQQLLKNNVFTDWTKETRLKSIKRKLQEQCLAVKLEKSLTADGKDTKNVILENYLNTINFGAGTYGIQTAAQTYFGKDCEDLTLSECAVLAPIPQNPMKWNPKNHPDMNARRRRNILNNMLKYKYITQDEYDEAIADDVYFRIQKLSSSSSSSTDTPYSYFIDELIKQIKKNLIKEKKYTPVQASNIIYNGGLRIYTTQDTKIQQIMDKEFQNEANFPKNNQIVLDWAMTVEHADGKRQNYSREMMQTHFRGIDPTFNLLFNSEKEAKSYINQYKASIVGPNDIIVTERNSFIPQPQASMTIIDQKTGYVKGIVGGRGKKTASLTLNRATDIFRQPGSTFKILSTYGPAIDLGYINLSTVVADEAYNYFDGSPVHNSDNLYHGNVTIRNAIMNSYNIVAVKTLTKITPQAGFNYLLRMGFSNLIKEKNLDIIQPLALGGITNGVSNLELTAAYTAIANGGVYIEPTFYTKVTDQNGNVILENKPVETRIFKESTSYLLTSAMKDVVTAGTGMDFKLNNMTVAGKTGTTSFYKDLVFVGFTPYYTAGIWAGYDVGVNLPKKQRNFYKTLWTNVMEQLHQNLPDVGFSPPNSVKKVTICSKTGLLAGNGCPKTQEYFELSQIPNIQCMKHYVPPTQTLTPTPSLIPTVESPKNQTSEPTEPPTVESPKNQTSEPTEPPTVESPKNQTFEPTEPPTVKSQKNQTSEPTEPPTVKSPKNQTSEPTEPPTVKSPKNKTSEPTDNPKSSE